MSRVVPADGLPIEGDVVVVADESTPETAAGVLYVVGAAALIDPAAVRLELHGMFEAPRKRPFHWVGEGVIAKQRIVDVITTAGFVAVANVRQVGRRGQMTARDDMVRLVAEFSASEGATHLMIEASDQATMSRDQSVLLDHHRGRGGAPFVYDWRTKNESLLWIADAVAGAAADWVTGKTGEWYDQLHDRGVLTVDFV